MQAMGPKHFIFAVEASTWCKVFGLDILPSVNNFIAKQKKETDYGTVRLCNFSKGHRKLKVRPQ